MASCSNAPTKDTKKIAVCLEPTHDVENGVSALIAPASGTLHRKLGSTEVQLFAIGGAIGTSLYVQMGAALPKGGPAGLFIGFLIWGVVMLCVNECFKLDRRSLPYLGKFQPYCSYVAMFGCLLMLLLLGFDLFLADGWSVMYFFLDYTFLAETKYVKAGTADLTVGGLVSHVVDGDCAAEKGSEGRLGLWARLFTRNTW
ncbi:hypothetical protein AC578_10723 [Pseudocercospora eumusae]|uniref:Amino acid permease/ SLC12A domain-containing protein n=1 Tax=Pseudocercospora eumusae TaxID=321146 RepID=A0A139H495_9PEZI|nr:hypothetical protein AC578_10723 [Pseudocercospora eumusae]